MSNNIYNIQKKLDRGFYLYSYTNRIAVYGPIPLAIRLFGKRKIGKDPRMIEIERQTARSLFTGDRSLFIGNKSLFTGNRSLFTSMRE